MGSEGFALFSGATATLCPTFGSAAEPPQASGRHCPLPVAVFSPVRSSRQFASCFKSKNNNGISILMASS
jgi:hypothetical protein